MANFLTFPSGGTFQVDYQTTTGCAFTTATGLTMTQGRQVLFAWIDPAFEAPRTCLGSVLFIDDSIGAGCLNVADPTCGQIVALNPDNPTGQTVPSPTFAGTGVHTATALMAATASAAAVWVPLTQITGP